MPSVFRWVIGAVVLAALTVAGCCALGIWRVGSALQVGPEAYERQRAALEADRRARTVVVTAADLIQEFGKDSSAADRKYGGKYLEISGVVERSGKARDDLPFIILNGGDDKAKLKIECFFESANKNEEAEIKRLDKGASITVRGEYVGQIANIQVRDCVLAQ